ncbi:hypothetical protein [Murimonas intestini]|uniref:hypothetical protein n=1 Tax=Murimonas intestini TaxID=1337051 RepID=UPI00214C136B|nr:hypothetical protein [Murimonas intestini]MCR1842784.1 hypothetical protein [Murimonas intestini]MCR1867877.1 hypothetical protein [Murimonas intestini]MCR1885228.1 hypothetical protein [Murimonas intestini]
MEKVLFRIKLKNNVFYACWRGITAINEYITITSSSGRESAKSVKHMDLKPIYALIDIINTARRPCMLMQKYLTD